MRESASYAVPGKGLVYLNEKDWVRDGEGKAKRSEEKLITFTGEYKDINT